MDALVMCGGRGTRLDSAVEKPLYEIAGRPMVGWVCDSLAASDIETTYAVVSPHTPETSEWVEVPVIETAGTGYVSDLQHALEQMRQPVLTVAADLPLLDGPAIDTVLDAHSSGSLTVCVPVSRKHALGVSVETTMKRECPNGEPKTAKQELAPTGVNIVSETADEGTYVTESSRFAVNVNYPRDAQIAHALKRELGDS